MIFLVFDMLLCLLVRRVFPREIVEIQCRINVRYNLYEWSLREYKTVYWKSVGYSILCTGKYFDDNPPLIALPIDSLTLDTLDSGIIRRVRGYKLTSPNCVLVNVWTMPSCSLGISGGNWHKVSSDLVNGHVDALLAPPPRLLLDLEDVGGGDRGGGGTFSCKKYERKKNRPWVIKKTIVNAIFAYPVGFVCKRRVCVYVIRYWYCSCSVSTPGKKKKKNNLLESDVNITV